LAANPKELSKKTDRKIDRRATALTDDFVNF